MLQPNLHGREGIIGWSVTLSLGRIFTSVETVATESPMEIDTSTPTGVASPPSFSIAFSVHWLSQAASR
jgi:hypothetical protein